MKTTTTAAIAAANELAYSDYHIHMGVDRRAVSKDLGTKTNISIWCYTNAGRYKGCYKCGSIDNATGEYTPGYDVDLTAALTAMSETATMSETAATMSETAATMSETAAAETETVTMSETAAAETETAAAETETAAAETTTLAGTEKQIAWATDLRAGAISAFRWAAANPSGAALAEPEKFAANIEKFIARIQSVKSAHQLIETFQYVDFGETNQMTLLGAVLHAMDGKFSPKYF